MSDEIFSLSLVTFLLGLALGRWRLVQQLAAHRKWHEFQLSAIRERIAAVEIVAHTLAPDRFWQAQKDLRVALHALDVEGTTEVHHSSGKPPA